MRNLDIDDHFPRLDDATRRQIVIGKLEAYKCEASARADAHRRNAQREPQHADGFLAWAAAYERQAAHYQQAIDLLTAAPMPPKDGPR